MSLSRRSLIRAGALALTSPALNVLDAAFAGGALAQTGGASKDWRHALSLFGDLKYPAGFKHFEYVNPVAPKGGTVRFGASGTFDNFNMIIAGLKGTLAAGTSFIYDTLTHHAQDEVTTEYGLLTDAVSHPDDFSSVTYRLRPEAKWHDGKPVTPEDVIYSLDTFKKNHPRYSAYYRHVVKAEKTGDREVTFTFDGPGNRELPLIVGQLFILPKHWWEGTDAQGRKRDPSATTLEHPLGSGPYRIKDFVAGRTITYERVKDYWGGNLNVNIGRNNFDEIRFEYYRDLIVALEAFKADALDWRTENSAKQWTSAYTFPAVQDKRVLREEFEIRSTGRMQAFAFNTRRDKFKDWRVRLAFNYAFDFEEMNKQLFAGQYKRIKSYFEGTELASSGLPQGLELEILQTVRDKVPQDVFTKEYTNPVNGSTEALRDNRREALRLFREAGYEVRDTRLVNSKTGEQLTVEFLGFEPDSERYYLFYEPYLKRLGVNASVRTIDTAQYQNRIRNWDFDVTTDTWSQSLSPGNEQRNYWGSPAADQPGSENIVGIKNEAVDAMIERVIFAKSREELVAATRALDRVLLWHHYVVPQWTYPYVRTARWDRFGRPDILPKYGASGFPTVWWWDGQRAAKTGSRQ